MDKVISIIFLFSVLSCKAEESCSKAYGCLEGYKIGSPAKFILYDVNIGEGFNLKRDVYMRMAMFVRNLVKKTKHDWHLVLPPWTKQPHWIRDNNQVSLRWHNFFDVNSMQLYSPVIEIDQFYAENGKSVDEVYILQHFPEFYQWDGKTNIDWSERWADADCRENPYWKEDNGSFIFFRGKDYVKSRTVKCISFQGTSAYLDSIIASTTVKSILFDHAEIATHMIFGDSDYWMCRRSMRFANHLVNAARSFRATHLNSSDEQDRIIRPLDWRDEQSHRIAQGGPYLGVHLRRRDFIHGRPNEIPSLDQSVEQIKEYLLKINLTTVFIASDMDRDEQQYITNALLSFNIKAVRFISEEMNKLNDGELAIIDQIIASHARVFVGTHESTFTYRIQEEREIMGFPSDTTFNRFCPSVDNEYCPPPTKWLIKYPTITSQDQNLQYLRKSDEL